MLTARDRQAFALRVEVEVLSENEMLTEQGDRVHTGSRTSSTAVSPGSSPPISPSCAGSIRSTLSCAAPVRPGIGVLAVPRRRPGGQAGWHMTCFGSQETTPVEHFRRPGHRGNGDQPPCNQPRAHRGPGRAAVCAGRSNAAGGHRRYGDQAMVRSLAVDAAAAASSLPADA